MPGMGKPMAPPKPVPKFEPSKPKLNGPKEGKTKNFGWKRIIIDRNGLGTGPDKKKATLEVIDNGMKKLDNNWKGIKTIWIDIKEDEKIKIEDIQAKFKDKVKAPPTNMGQVAAAVNKKQSHFSDA